MLTFFNKYKLGVLGMIVGGILDSVTTTLLDVIPEVVQ